jgi:hypothetical protein
MIGLVFMDRWRVETSDLVRKYVIRVMNLLRARSGNLVDDWRITISSRHLKEIRQYNATKNALSCSAKLSYLVTSRQRDL